MVSRRLENKVQRSLTTIHCIAHRLELAVLDTVKKCPYLSKFEDTVKSIFKFYFYSPKRQREVNEIAMILHEDTVYYSGVQKTDGYPYKNEPQFCIQFVYKEYTPDIHQCLDVYLMYTSNVLCAKCWCLKTY